MRTLLIALLLSPLGALAVDPGNWELSVVTLLGGQDKPASAVQTRCFTERDARDPDAVLGNLGGTCEFTNRSDDGSTYTFNVACTGPLPMKGSGTVRYTAGTLDGDLDLTDDKGGFGMRTTVKGRRLGPC